MIIPTSVEPKTIIVIEYNQIVAFHIIDSRVYTVRISKAFTPGDKTGHMRLIAMDTVLLEPPIPPLHIKFATCKEGAVHR